MITEVSNLPAGREPTDNIWQALHTQRAIRYWQARKVPRDLLEQVILAASKAPSGSNTQPWVFVVVDDEKTLLSIADALRAMWDRAEPLRVMVDQGSQSTDKTTRLMLQGARAFFSELERAPALIIPCLYGLTSPTHDPRSIEAGSSIFLAVQNMLLAARALGLGTVMTTAHKGVEPVLREVLSIPDDAYPVALIPIGFPDANFGPTKRKGLSEILCWNRWSV